MSYRITGDMPDAAPQLHAIFDALESDIAAIPAPLDSPNISIPGYTAADVGFTIRNENTTAGNLEGIAFANANADQVLIGAVNLGSTSTAGGRFFIATRKAGQAALAERLSVTDVGLGIGIATPTSIFDVNTLPTNGAMNVLRMRTNETNSGDFGFRYVASPGSNGETRRDNQMLWGYNINGLSGEHAFVEAIESRYKTSEGILQLEQYYQFNAGSESSLAGTWRPFSITCGLTNSAIAIALGADQIAFWDKAHVGDGAGLPFFSMDLNAANLILHGDSGIVYGGTRDWAISSGGVGLVSKQGITRLVPSTDYGAAGFAQGVSEVNFMRNLNPFSDFMYLTMGGSLNYAGFRWNPTALRLEYATSYQANGVNSESKWRPFNDWSSNVRYYGFNRSLGANVGDYVEIGTISNVDETGVGNFQIEVLSDDQQTFKRFEITKTSGDASGTWLEVLPSLSGPAITDGGDFAVDIKNLGTGGHNIRLRRTVANVYGTQIYNLALRIFDRFNAFGASSSSGSSATVSGTYRWIPLTQSPTGLGIGTSNPGALLDIGLAGSRLGVIRLAGSTSGNVTIQPTAAAGTYTLTLPTGDGDSGQVLTTDGSGNLSWTTPSGGGGGSGDVVGPASATDNAITRYDGTTGKLIQNSLVTVSDTGILTVPAGTVVNPSLVVGSDPGVGLSSQFANNLDFTVASNQQVGRITANGDWRFGAQSLCFDFGGAFSGANVGMRSPSSGLLTITDGANASTALRDLKLRAIEMVDGNLVLSTSTGTKIGTATSQKLSLWNATPITQPTGIVDADGTLADITAKFNALVAKLEALGALAVA